MQGQLFSSDFLLRGIRETETWKSIPDQGLDAFIGQLKTHYAPYSAESSLNEGQTEDEQIEPVIDLLGWQDAWISQVNLSESGRESVKPPFVWNPEDRAHRMARLDALFFHLYGLSEDDADYILSTFPIVREQDMKAHGRYRTRDLILGYLARIEAGRLDHEDLEQELG